MIRDNLKSIARVVLFTALDRVDDVAASLLGVETRVELRHLAQQNAGVASKALENRREIFDRACALDREKTAVSADLAAAQKRIDELVSERDTLRSETTAIMERARDLEKERHDEWYLVHCENIDGTPVRDNDGQSRFNVVRHRGVPYEHGGHALVFEEARALAKKLNANREAARVIT